MTTSELSTIGVWSSGPSKPAFTGTDLLAALPRVREAAHVVRESAQGRIGVAYGGEVRHAERVSGSTYPWLATLPPLFPEWLQTVSQAMPMRHLVDAMLDVMVRGQPPSAILPQVGASHVSCWLRRGHV